VRGYGHGTSRTRYGPIMEMEPGTWVALWVGLASFVIGVGSLITTLVLDARNRKERTGTDGLNRTERAQVRGDEQTARDIERQQVQAAREAERREDQAARDAERREDRWSRDKQIAYADICGELFGWFDDITDRDSKRIASPAGSHWAQEDNDRWRPAIAARGAVDLLAPSGVRDASVLAITAVLLYASEVRANANPRSAAAEREPALRLTGMMRDAMRADLGIPELESDPPVGAAARTL
jgi:hypothetical protein